MVASHLRACQSARAKNTIHLCGIHKKHIFQTYRDTSKRLTRFSIYLIILALYQNFEEFHISIFFDLSPDYQLNINVLTIPDQ